jgi:hypothetical protein
MEKYSFNHIFYWCADFLKTLAAMLIITYEEINVWIFCMIEAFDVFYNYNIIRSGFK